MNTFRTRLRMTSFGKSHGKTIDVVLDGMPLDMRFNEEFLQNELGKRKGGSKFATPREESDEAEILSGAFEGLTTRRPIAMLFHNESTRSKDYSKLKSLFRPSHADFSYFQEYGIGDYRGGGRSSARGNMVRVTTGAVVAMLLGEFGVEILSGIFGVGGCVPVLKNNELDFEFADKSEIFYPDKDLEEGFKQEVLEAKKAEDSVEAIIFAKVSGVRTGLEEVLYDKLDSKLAHALMGINTVKVVEIGSSIDPSQKRGSQNSDSVQNGKFLSNHSRGILGGISNGGLIELRGYFKPIPSIFLVQETINEDGENIPCELSGRHDSCVGIRGSMVTNAMVGLVMADALLLNASTNLHHLKATYKS